MSNLETIIETYFRQITKGHPKAMPSKAEIKDIVKNPNPKKASKKKKV